MIKCHCSLRWLFLFVLFETIPFDHIFLSQRNGSASNRLQLRSARIRETIPSLAPMRSVFIGAAGNIFQADTKSFWRQSNVLKRFFLGRHFLIVWKCSWKLAPQKEAHWRNVSKCVESDGFWKNFATGTRYGDVTKDDLQAMSSICKSCCILKMTSAPQNPK